MARNVPAVASGGNELAVCERRIPTRRRFSAFHDPIDERDSQRARGVGHRIGILRQRASADDRLHACEAASSTAVRRAGHVVAAHIVGQRNVFRRVGSDEVRRQTQSPEFGGPEGFDDLRTRMRDVAPIEQAAGRRDRERHRCSVTTTKSVRCPARRASPRRRAPQNENSSASAGPR